jgi:hypothetical protein
MIDNLQKIIERDEKLEELLVKGENIDNQAKTYKIKARESNRTMCRRKWCCWLTVIGTILLVGVGTFLILWLWLKVIKF